MPRITVRAMAEMLRLPALAQMRILADQKYPKQEPQVFRTPYYKPVLDGIRDYYRSGNDQARLNAAMTTVQKISLDTRRTNNTRALQAFRKSSASKRKLTVRPNKRFLRLVDTVELRLSADMQALEDGELHVFFFNCKAAKLDDNVVRRAIEIAHWILEGNESKVLIKNVEFVDLFTGKTHSTQKRRAATTKAVVANAQAIDALWNSL